jgi:hypothetical protein
MSIIPERAKKCVYDVFGTTLCRMLQEISAFELQLCQKMHHDSDAKCNETKFSMQFY